MACGRSTWSNPASKPLLIFQASERQINSLRLSVCDLEENKRFFIENEADCAARCRGKLLGVARHLRRQAIYVLHHSQKHGLTNGASGARVRKSDLWSKDKQLFPYEGDHVRRSEG